MVADNLAAHCIAGFVESFSAELFCQFCMGKNSDVKVEEVRSGAFNLRDKDLHQDRVKTALANGTSCCGVKRVCFY